MCYNSRWYLGILWLESYVKFFTLRVQPNAGSEVTKDQLWLRAGSVWCICGMTDSVRYKFSDKNLPQCHFAHRESNKDCPGLNTGLHNGKTAPKPCELKRGLWLSKCYNFRCNPFLCLMKYSAMKTYWVSGGIAPCIHNHCPSGQHHDTAAKTC
jgi:hypothetical protein